MSRIYLVRHGTHGLIGKALAGRMDGVSLSDEGRAEAERLALHFERLAIADVMSSPLDRCRETAAPIAGRLSLGIAIDPALNEIDCGEWTGCDFETLHDDPRWHAWNNERERHAIPGGERVQEVQSRVMPFLDPIAARDGGATVLVSHSDVIKVVAMTVLGLPLASYDRLQIDPASITTIDLWPGGGKVVRLNEAAA